MYPLVDGHGRAGIFIFHLEIFKKRVLFVHSVSKSERERERERGEREREREREK